MASTRAYWNTLKSIRDQIALKMGVDPSQTSKEVRAMSNATLAAVGVLAKTLSDKNVVTDAELLARANAALSADGSVWDDEPINPPPSITSP